MKYLFLYFLIVSCLLSSSTTGQESRSVPDSVVKKMQDQPDFRYANDPRYWKEDPPAQNTSLEKFLRFLGGPAMRIVLYGVVGLIVLFILYQVIVVNRFFVSGSRRRKKADNEAGYEEDLPIAELDERIRQAIAAGEYRLAVRYLFLKTLHDLNEKNAIRLQARSTNHEYLRQMQESPRYRDFSVLTRIYEYVWYGKFQPGPGQFDTIHSRFQKFLTHP